MIPLQSAEHKSAASCGENKDLQKHIHELPERWSTKFLFRRRSNDLKWGDLLYRSSREKTDGRMKLEMCKIQINTEDNLAQAEFPLANEKPGNFILTNQRPNVCCDVTWQGHNKQTYRITNITSVTQGSHPAFLPHSSCLGCLGTLLNHLLLSVSDHTQAACRDNEIIKTIN